MDKIKEIIVKIFETLLYMIGSSLLIVAIFVAILALVSLLSYGCIDVEGVQQCYLVLK